jgi:hypothetical protein
MPSSFDKGRIITVINNGMSYRHVAEQLGIQEKKQFVELLETGGMTIS